MTMALVLQMSLRQQLKQAGVEVTAKIAHEGDKADYSAEVGVLSAAGGDALAVLGYIDQGGNNIIRGSLDAGSFDQFALGDGMIGTSLEDAFGDELNGSGVRLWISWRVIPKNSKHMHRLMT